MNEVRDYTYNLVDELEEKYINDEITTQELFMNFHNAVTDYVAKHTDYGCVILGRDGSDDESSTPQDIIENAFIDLKGKTVKDSFTIFINDNFLMVILTNK